ncbi:superoxide dismutase family protein [Virgibacillus sp. 179-BFC.A HS]|uniref:Superoxide dismutase family protein n=1 Tax=Tigheibacillus jepli TaxID=3035914 RepID=A0ABU5CG48_9BACI|nr:superoxide dismutase family protein [Virgibacillus sp. 179-BFC.A HS]MDY0405256.1 superoxide dismutase family protein [Virgibacillus sp. 179-BFC.A HS]
MRFFMACFIVLLLFSAVACQSQSSVTNKKITLYNQSGDSVGTAELVEEPDGVKITVNAEGLSPGYHGIHIHEHPKCSGNHFQSAGNHLNPEGKKHGAMHPKGAHLGDLPNIEADSDGKAKAELKLAEATLKEGKKSLLKKEGTSLIITAGQDDGISQPSGNSGERIICGKITSKLPK